jgi:acylphosphatase
MIARHVVIRGRVQGVGFRYAAVDAAERHRVAGWVRNRNDGAVEALVQGDAESVSAMIEWCRRGPSAARVMSVDVAEAAPEPLTGFMLRPTA